MILRILSQKKAVYIYFFFFFLTHPHLYDIMANSSFSRLYKPYLPCIIHIFARFHQMDVNWSFNRLVAWRKYWLRINATAPLRWNFWGSVGLWSKHWNSARLTVAISGCVHIDILRAGVLFVFNSKIRWKFCLSRRFRTIITWAKIRRWTIARDQLAFSPIHMQNRSSRAVSRIAFARRSRGSVVELINHKHHPCCC